MNFLINYWYFIVAAIALVAVVVKFAIDFSKKPTSAQMDAIKQWLLYAVTEAQKNFGGGTGKLKLAFVYDAFVNRFPQLAGVVSAETFSTLVDQVLVKFREMLENNKKIKEYVEGSEE